MKRSTTNLLKSSTIYYNSLKLTSTYRFVLFPGERRPREGGSRGPWGQFPEGSESFRSLQKVPRRFEKVGEIRGRLEKVEKV